MDSNLTFSLLKLYDCFLAPYRPREVSHYILYKIKIIFKLNYKLKFKKNNTHINTLNIIIVKKGKIRSFIKGTKKNKIK